MRRRDVLIGAGFATTAVGMPALVSGLAITSGHHAPATGFEGRALGTGYRVKLGVQVTGSELEGLRTQASAVLADIDCEMSTFRPDSEIARFNGAAANSWMTLSPDTVMTLAEAKRISALSGGAFDPSVGPLVDLWGFGPRGLLAFPNDADVAAAVARVDFASVELDAARQRARKRRDDVALDLCGIAKGRAVDRLSDLLEAHGLDRYLIDVGGELRARGERLGGGSWRIGIEQPGRSVGSPLRVLALDNLAVATSGDYRSFYMRGGQRYTHSVDPRLGCPVTHGISSVSVVAETALTADALSTAMIVLGPEAGLDLANEWKIPARLLVRERERFVEYLSEQFATLLRG